MLGDASRGLELALINDLQYPFIVSQGEEVTEGVISVGDIIIIPDGASLSDSIDDAKTDLLASALGSDLLLVADQTNLSYSTGGELVADLYGDLQTISGVLVLKQDLINRLVTPIGTLPYHPDYGSKFVLMIGNKKDITWKQKCEIELSRTFLSDPRVKDLRNVRITDISTGVRIECDVVTAVTTFSLSEMIQ
jgi:phage baseplate assembly protein W